LFDNKEEPVSTSRRSRLRPLQLAPGARLERFLESRRLERPTADRGALGADAEGPASAPHGLWKYFGNLRIRAKLVVLHNLFFLVLAAAVYWSVIPAFQQRVATARAREVSFLYEMLSADRPLKAMAGWESYDLKEGTADQVGVAGEVRQWLDARPGSIWQQPAETDYVYRKSPATGLYRRLRAPNVAYDDVVERARATLFLVLGLIYVLAVALLELSIMPQYVYQPLRLMLRADQATRSGNRGREMIPEELIPGDEIGRIMRSRNETVGELRRHEDELQQTLEQLETARDNLMEQDRLASLGLLSASVAHEINTPLAVLHGSIEKLAETVPDKAAQDRLARMLRVTERLRRISSSLLDFARARKQEMGRVAVRALVDEAWHLVAIDDKAAEVSFANNVEAGAAVCGNADRLVQVFVNLLRNALIAVTAPGGRISVRSREASGSIAITVEDNGPGIPPEVLPEIFDAFVTTRLDARGTGLGLTVAEGIVHQHGGTIAAANRPEGGASLEVVLRAAGQAG
jgi:C4-dicarboxylate-specific signal transduction histidine kinase